jgi:predicted acylesterase/phospholipase RssA
MLRDDTKKNVVKAKSILRGEHAKPDAILKLAKSLKNENRFGHARKLLNRALTYPEVEKDKGLKLEIGQQHALCTYKDPDLPVGDRLKRAFQILNKADNILKTKDQETLGLAGAIFKRSWEVEGHKDYLERSLAYYNRGYEQGPKSDYGYTGINAAFVLDQLADLEEKQAEGAGAGSGTARERREKAKQIRENLVEELPGLVEQKDWLSKEYWFFVTIAEAYFGLQKYNDAGHWLQKAVALPNLPPWELETTARQLAVLFRLHSKKLLTENEIEKTPAWKVLKEFLEDKAAGVRTVFLGKVGLALSGGGFRASLYHIGVLAKLAELDMLRHVEVLSCVSGGSIIGAHYYLEVRRLLEAKADHEITCDDYIQIVRRICKRFLQGVQRNIRTRVAAEFLTNLKMIFKQNFSRTQRAGELYEQEIYSLVEDGEGDKHRWLNKLFIHPQGEHQHFKPKYDNWRRSAKVPILILNAATLNTGHNWQFTASWMGEPPSSINTDIDGNYRLRRMYYHEAPIPHQRIRLGHAVAASACVPGLFEPIVFPKLYNRENTDITVRLVDGGVHDNQGTMGLLDQDCNAIIVSDASGQMGTQDDPGGGVIEVPLRSNSILMARVREAEYRELDARLRSSQLRNLMFIHLKKDLDVNPLDWIDCQDPVDASDEARPVHKRGILTSYGIVKEIQERLAAIRTDLDSFSDKEAFALMTSGYRMAEHEFKQQFSNFPTSTEKHTKWDFLAIEEAMQDRSKSEELMHLLQVGSQRAFKIWQLCRPLNISGWILGAVALAALLWICWNWSSVALITLGTIGSSLAVLILGGIFSKTVMRVVRYRETLMQIIIGVAMALAGWILARIHLHIFDKLFLEKGRLKN